MAGLGFATMVRRRHANTVFADRGFYQSAYAADSKSAVVSGKTSCCPCATCVFQRGYIMSTKNGDARCKGQAFVDHRFPNGSLVRSKDLLSGSERASWFDPATNKK
uniref:Uncharacterized protein n=1 Tax=Oryza sativa subsp. japonica TaxID=39947 RepID=Q8GRI7_ORYSJ|nr:hypothetical protein [Oryza sativa Japonica Group]BAC22301.1 hypothetical protein [Oryza sativa Japonica Group]